MRDLRVVCGVATGTLLAGVSSADLIHPISQDRSVHAVVNDQGHNEQQDFSASDFSHFFAEALVYNTTARQDSTIGANSISGSLFSQASASINGISHSDVFCDVTFSLLQPVSYSANAQRGTNNDLFFVRLNGPSGNVFELGFFAPDFGPPSQSNSGTLTPGTYTLQAHTRAYAGGVNNFSRGSSGTFAFSVVPAPGAAAVLAAGLLSMRRRRSEPGV